jgi:hypothetical protein
MNIDERLDRLAIFVERMAEKHDGLNHSVELLVSMHNEHERIFQEHRNEFQEHKRLVGGAIESLAETNRQIGETNRQLAQIMAGMRSEQQQDRQEFRDVMMRLSVIAEAHQDTLDDHEKRLGNRTP